MDLRSSSSTTAFLLLCAVLLYRTQFTMSFRFFDDPIASAAVDDDDDFDDLLLSESLGYTLDEMKMPSIGEPDASKLNDQESPLFIGVDKARERAEQQADHEFKFIWF